MPYCRANSTAACQSESGNFTRPDWLPRKSSNWRCNCKIGSGVVDVDLRFIISRLRRLTQLNNAGPRPSRILAGNSRTRRLYWLSTHKAVFKWLVKILTEEGLI